MKKKWFWILIFTLITTCTGRILFSVGRIRGEEKGKNLSLKITEEHWQHKGTNKISTSTVHYMKGVKEGDTLFDSCGYKITLKSISAKKIILTQEGGLVKTNENGSFNALKGAKKQYKMKIGEKIVLRSYSLHSGIMITIERDDN